LAPIAAAISNMVTTSATTATGERRKS